MLVFLQFTLTDLRTFAGHADEILTRPGWPSPMPFEEFVRGTGRVIERRKSGLNNWVGENYICEIGRQIQVSASNGSAFTLKPIYKHLYSSEYQVLTKYEFVFKVVLNKQPKTSGAVGDYNFISDIIRNVLNTKVGLRVDGEFTTMRAYELAKKLPQFHYNSTTYHKLKEKQHQLLILPCNTQIYIVAEKKDLISNLSNNFKAYVLNPDKGTLYGSWYDHTNRAIRVWVQDPEFSDRATNRKLRMTIMRLHAEYGCLRNIFLAIQQGLITNDQSPEASQKLSTYFKGAINTFLKHEQAAQKNGIEIDFLDYFSKIFSKAHPGQLQDLIKKMNEYLPDQQIIQQVSAFIHNGNINHINNNNYNMTNNTFNNNNNIVGAQGDGNIVHQHDITQINNQLPENTDYEALFKALEALKANALTVAQSGEDYKAVGAIAEAAEAAEKSDGNGLIMALKAGGKFVSEVATKFSASLIVELMKAHHLLI